MTELWLRILNLLNREGPLTSYQIAKRLKTSRNSVQGAIKKLTETGIVRKAWITKRRTPTRSRKLETVVVGGRKLAPIYYLPSQKQKVAKILVKKLKKPKNRHEKKSMSYLLKNSELEPWLESFIKNWAEGKLRGRKSEK